MPSRIYHRIKNNIEYKFCNKCNNWIELSMFYSDSTKWDKLSSNCKICKNSESSRRGLMRYYYRNKKILNFKKVKYARERCKNDYGFRLAKNLRSRLRYALKPYSIKKNTSAINLVGCDAEYLRSYLEYQFNEKMSWENYGVYWEVDHKIPCDKFDLSNIEQQKICFHYTNLQPLSIHENRSKSNRVFYK